MAELIASGTTEANSADFTLAATVSLTVTNTGDRPGAEVVQVYVCDPDCSVQRPVRELKGFGRVQLEPGESRRVAFSLHADRTAFTGVDLTRVVEPGWFTVWVGHSSEDLPLTARFRVTGTVRVIEGARELVTPVTVS